MSRSGHSLPSVGAQTGCVLDRDAAHGGAARLRPCLSLLLATCCLFLTACPKRETAPDGQTLRLSQRNEPATLDPQLATLPDEFFVIRALSEGLVTPNPDGGAPLPAAAQSWTTSSDGLTWTFQLRPESRWSDGTPVTATDFVFTIRRALTAATAAPKAPLFFALKNAAAFYRGTLSDFSQVGVAARDPHLLVFTLEQPQPDFLARVASGPWIPVHPATVQRHGPGWAQPGRFVGNGRFTLASWAPHQRLVAQRRADHWGAADTRVAALEFLAFDNGDTEERAFRAGQVDLTLSVPSSKLDTYRGSQPLVLQTIPLHETRYLALNVTRPPLNDVRVRRALSLALDRAELVNKVLKGGQRPARSFIPPGLGGHQPATTLAENVAEARRLLAEAGFPEGRGFPRLELTTWGASTIQLEAVQQRWREHLGITLALVQREARTHLAALAAGNFDVGFINAIPDYDSAADLLRELTGGDAGNYPHWRDAEYDRLFASGDLAGAESRLLHEMPVIPLYFNTKNFLLHPAVRGWREDALWTRYYDHVFLEK